MEFKETLVEKISPQGRGEASGRSNSRLMKKSNP
jgi:hypothetical protein